MDRKDLRKNDSAPKSKPAVIPQATEGATYPSGEPELPQHFSAISAQKGPEHNEAAHRAMHSDLKLHGFNPTHTNGSWGYQERSFIVPHNGTEHEKKTLEEIAFKKYGQEAILHSSNLQNRIVNADGSPDWLGSGYTQGHHLDDMFTLLPSGHKVRMTVHPPKAKEEAVTKSEKKLHKPHYYGKVDKIHVFHGTHDSHRELEGIHLDDPTEDNFKATIKDAKKRDVPVVVIHGSPPDSLRSRIHPELGAGLPGKVAKSFSQGPDQPLTDSVGHVTALKGLPPELVKFGYEKLSKLPKDAVESIDVKGQTIKVRKHDADLYSGWIEHDGNITHKFERVTMPELMVQIQSKLEMYGQEEPKVEPVKELPKPEPVKPESKEEAKDLGDKIKELRDKIKEKIGDHPALNDEVVVPGKELDLDGPDACSDCGSSRDLCDCFTGLPMPQIRVDQKGVHIFFKSEWQQEERESFVEDLKRRAGRIVRRRTGR